MSINLDAQLDKASLVVRTVPVCLDGEKMGALQDALDALESHQPEPGPSDTRLAGSGSSDATKAELQRAVKEAQDAVQAASLPFKVRGLTRTAYTTLLAAHPPRDDDPVDRRIGYNDETFSPALLRACLIDPSPTEEQWPRLEALLVFGQHDALVAAAVDASRRRVDVPFSLAASVKSRKTAG